MSVAGLLGLQYEFRWSVLWEPPYGSWLLQGLKLTVVLSLLAWALALGLGILLGVLRTTPWRLPRLLATAWVEFFRNTPLLVQLFFWYFAVPQLLPGALRDRLNSLHLETALLVVNYEAVAGLLGLGIYTSARVGETVRAGLGAIPRPQTEAALSTGLGLLQVYRYVLVPLAVRLVIPPLTTEFLTIFKNSSVAVTIGVAEITFQTQQINAYTFRGLEAVTAATLVYLAISLTIAAVMSWLERRWAVPGMVRRGGAAP